MDSNTARAIVEWLVANWIALVALLLSMAAFVGQFFHGRKAHISVHFIRTPEVKGQASHLVIVNHGPADARDIGLRFETSKRDSWEPWHSSAHGVERRNPFPIKRLASGASFLVPVFPHYEDGPGVTAYATWRDRRFMLQRWISTVSTAGQPVGGESVQKYHQEQEWKRRQAFLKWNI